MALTDDDRQWIKIELGQLREYIDERTHNLREYIDERTHNLRDYIDERTHDAETRLLRGFADHNTAIGTRFRKLEADASNLNTSSTMRLGELERLVTEMQAKLILIEGRLPK